MSKKGKIVYMGTPDFAVPALKALNEVYDVAAVVTVPDKPKGRGLKLAASPVKECALELGIQVLQPVSLKDEEFVNRMKEIAPDIIVVIAFRILPKAIYEIPTIASFNIHGSLLPKFRGAAPINWAIINGEQVTGLTSFILQEKVDTGSMLLQKVWLIPENEGKGTTAGELHDALMDISSGLALDTCDLLYSDKYKALAQDESLASPAPKIFRDTAKIDWNKEPLYVRNFINGMSPSPGAWTNFEGKSLKIYRTQIGCSVSNPDTFGEPGSYVIKDGKFLVQCKSGLIELLEIQPEGKKAMLVSDYLKGFRGAPNGSFII